MSLPAQLAFGCGPESLSISAPRLPVHFYFHVPFCRSKCAYCDFYSLTLRGAPTRLLRFFRGLEAEVRQWADLCLPGEVNTVYIGGGTPSLCAEQVGRLLGLVRRVLPIADGAEITVEANPDSLSPEVLSVLEAAGVTRVSLGVQSFDDRILRVLGRAHDVARALEACEWVAASGAALSLDLMCGIPGQSMVSWRNSLGTAANMGARHVSVYPLSVEEGTPLAKAIARGELAEPDSDMAADMMLEAEILLAENGLLRYEVANYAVPGFESAHNTAYWTGGSYAGIGPAAHGMLDSGTARAIGLPLPDSTGERDRVRYAVCSGCGCVACARDVRD